MDRKLRIAFLWAWDSVDSQTYTWRDGLYAALRELKARGHEILLLTHGLKARTLQLPDHDIEVLPKGEAIKKAIEAFRPDVILQWGDMSRPDADVGRQLGIKQAICFAGGNPLGPTLRNFDHVFVESEVYKRRFQDADVPCSTAFGTNTKLFDPDHLFVKGQQKTFDIIFPATYAQWKKHEKFAEVARGLKAVACGYMYDTHELHCWQVCQDAGVLTLPHVSADTLRTLYAASRLCVITSDSTGGSQRTVLEAMAMNVPLIVSAGSDKTTEYMRDAMDKGYRPGGIWGEDRFQRGALADMEDQTSNARDYILKHWSEHQYADALEKGLCTLIS